MAHFKDMSLSSELANACFINIGGSKVPCRVIKSCWDDGESFFSVIHDGDSLNLLNSLQSHIESFFHPSFDALLEIEIEEDELSLPNLRGIKGSGLEGSAVHTSFLETFYTTYPDQLVTAISCQIKGPFKADARLFQIDHMIISNSECSAPAILENFNGKSLFLNDANVNDRDIIAFLQKWMSKKYYNNLELLVIETVPPIWLNINAILRNFQTKPWDLTRRPREYVYHSKAFGDALQLKCRGAEELTRDIDGKVTSVNDDGNPRSFTFCVWSEEQLKMKNDK